jgi:hypothetical protein
MQPNSVVRQAVGEFAPTLAWLRRTIDPRIAGFTTECIKTNTVQTRVHRVTLEFAGGHPGCRSIIVKTTVPGWPEDPHGPDRELWFYSKLFPRIGFDHPRVHHAGIDPATGRRILVMEDLAGDYRFPPPTHRWSFDELRCALRAYARLHQRGRERLPSADERARLWQMALQQRPWRVDEILTLVDDLTCRGIWARMAGIEQLTERTLVEQADLGVAPPTLLHNDVYPPNVALPHDLDGEAVLLDWEMLGWGMAELDLAFMFLQPFRSAEGIDRLDALDYYWEQRCVLGGSSPRAGERQALQRHADACWALSLVPVAHRAAVQPYPDGSAERTYWDAMFGVLGERLKELCEGEGQRLDQSFSSPLRRIRPGPLAGRDAQLPPAAGHAGRSDGPDRGECRAPDERGPEGGAEAHLRLGQAAGSAVRHLPGQSAQG